MFSPQGWWSCLTLSLETIPSKVKRSMADYRVSGEIVPLVQQDFHCFTAIFHQSFVLLGIFHLRLEKSRCQSPRSHSSSPHPPPPSVSLTSDVWSHSALARLMPFPAMERKNEGTGNSKCSVLLFTCCLPQQFFVLFVALNSSSSDPPNRRILLRLPKKPNKIYNHQ